MDYTIKPVREKRFNIKLPESLFAEAPFRAILCGKSQLSGKSTVIYNLLAKFLKDVFEPENIFIFNPSIAKEEKYLKLIKKLSIPIDNIFSKFERATVAGVVKAIDDEVSMLKSEGEEVPQYLIILDDCGTELRTDKRADIIDRIASQGRHSNISMIVCCQKYTQISTCVRENSTNMLIFGCSDKQMKLCAEDHSCGCSQTQFINMLRETTKRKHSFLHINYHRDIDKRYQSNFAEFLDPSKY